MKVNGQFQPNPAEQGAEHVKNAAGNSAHNPKTARYAADDSENSADDADQIGMLAQLIYD